MSLRITVSCTGANGKQEKVSLEPGRHLAGFEESRYDFWGADIMHHLGLKLLPQLKDGNNIFAGGETLNQLEAEVRIIQEHVETIAEQTPYDRQFVMSRTDNVLHAIELAREIDGTVSIG